MVENATRLTLLGRLKEGGSDTDWIDFNRFYHGLVRSWARHFGCPDSAVEDIYQNTMMAIIPSLPRFKHTGKPGCFRSWLKTIVQRRVYDHFRREMKHVPKVKGDEDDQPKLGVKRWHAPADEQADPDAGNREATMDKLWLRQLMEEGMKAAKKRVKPEKYESFRRYVIYQEPVTDVSRDMGIRVGTIFQHKSSFLDVLREEFLRMLDGLHDLGPDMSEDSKARKRLKVVLEDFIQTQRDIRNTVVVEEPVAEPSAEMSALQAIVRDHSPPHNGPVIMHVAPDMSHSWLPVVERVCVGSGESNDLVLSGNGISEVHAEIVCEDDVILAKDRNSTNGLYLNGRRIGEWELQPGDCLRITDHYLVFLDNSGLVQA
jgi:RNA polymerase sigma factor (sigma-70 family)